MITVIGLGFVGLTTALGFADKGIRVFGYDHDPEKTQALKKLIVPFYEPGLEDALTRNLGCSFEIVDELAVAVEQSDVVFFCVGTPGKVDGSADLSYLKQAIDNILTYCGRERFRIMVVKSTIPPSTTKETIVPHIEKQGWRVGDAIGVANNPEFLREGCAWEDFMRPDRVVLGVSDDRTGKVLSDLYEPFGACVHNVSLNTGEFVKYLSNTLLSTMISYSNEMSMLADAVGDIDIRSAFRILHEDKRWFGQPANMSSYVYPGCGFGGYCLPKDTEALYMMAQAKGYEARGLKHVLQVNEDIRNFIVDKIEGFVDRDKTIGILGLSFKAGSDDIRDTPARHIIESMLARGYRKIIAYDPMANALFAKTYGFDIQYTDTLEALLEQVDCCVLLTAWDEFKQNKELINSVSSLDFRYT